MLKTRTRTQQDSNKRPPTVNFFRGRELESSPPRTSSIILSDSYIQNHVFVPQSFIKKEESIGLSFSRINAQTPTDATPKSSLLINKRLTKGYSKFLEEKELIDTREEERAKIEKDVKKTLTKENSKIMSKDIQKLICSTILHDPTQRPKTALKVVDDNSFVGQKNSVEERHKHICNRILGEGFENSSLFVKVQEVAASQSQSIQSIPEKLNHKISHVTKTQNSIIKRTTNEYFFPVKKERKRKSSNRSSVCWSMLTLLKERINHIRTATDETAQKIMSLNTLGSESTKLISATTISLTDIEPNSEERNPSIKVVTDYEEDGNIAKKVDVKQKKSILGQTLCQTAFQNNLKIRLKMKKSQVSEKSLNQSQATGERSTSKSKNTTVVFRFLTGTDTIDSKSHLDSKVYENQEKEDAGIDKINQLCQGIIQSTGKLCLRLKKQKFRITKDFERLDTQMERLTYQNNIKNWENSVKQVENIQKESTFFNLVL